MFTYFVSNGKYVKIGKAQHVESRVTELQVGSPVELKVLFSFVGDREAEFHLKFYKHRVRGEWFLLVPEIEEFILTEKLKLDPVAYQKKLTQDLFDQTQEEKEWGRKLAAWVEEVCAPSEYGRLGLLTMTAQRRIVGYLSSAQQTRWETMLRSFGFTPAPPDVGRRAWFYQFESPNLELESSARRR